jgi:hypothetical protein
VNKLGTVGFLTDKNTKHKCQVLAEKRLDEIGERLEHSP